MLSIGLNGSYLQARSYNTLHLGMACPGKLLKKDNDRHIWNLYLKITFFLYFSRFWFLYWQNMHQGHENCQAYLTACPGTTKYWRIWPIGLLYQNVFLRWKWYQFGTTETKKRLQIFLHLCNFNIKSLLSSIEFWEAKTESVGSIEIRSGFNNPQDLYQVSESPLDQEFLGLPRILGFCSNALKLTQKFWVLMNFSSI